LIIIDTLSAPVSRCSSSSKSVEIGNVAPATADDDISHFM